jgi:hypothetical protein
MMIGEEEKKKQWAEIDLIKAVSECARETGACLQKYTSLTLYTDELVAPSGSHHMQHPGSPIKPSKALARLPPGQRLGDTASDCSLRLDKRKYGI